MTRNIGYCALIVFSGVIIVLSAYAPLVLSDNNAFLKDFVNHEFIAVLGIILAITLASIAQLHLAMNQIEERYQQDGGLRDTRSGVHLAAHVLIVLFFVGVLLVVIKPLSSAEP